MKVILIENIKGTGKKGQVLDVAEGHARNFLLPRKLAIEATKENLSGLEYAKKNEEKRRIEDLEDALEMKKELESKIIKIKVKTGGKGKLFGSVTNTEIAEELEKQARLVIDRKKIVIAEPIRTTGEKKVDVKLHSEVMAKLTIDIEEAE